MLAKNTVEKYSAFSPKSVALRVGNPKGNICLRIIAIGYMYQRVITSLPINLHQNDVK